MCHGFDLISSRPRLAQHSNGVRLRHHREPTLSARLTAAARVHEGDCAPASNVGFVGEEQERDPAILQLCQHRGGCEHAGAGREGERASERACRRARRRVPRGGGEAPGFASMSSSSFFATHIRSLSLQSTT